MSRRQHNPLALFSLVPKNSRSQNVLDHPFNKHLVSCLKDGQLALDVGHFFSKSGSNTLATLGRGDVDIFIPGSTISKTQCSFEINPDTEVVMFYDRSHGQTSQVSGENATPFQHGRPRKVVVQKGLNSIVGMGGVRRDQVLFELQWHNTPDKTMERIKERKSTTNIFGENPRFARTVDDADTVVPSAIQTRIHTPGLLQPRVRYAKIGNKLGAGQFGEVYKAVDVDSGMLVAVKILHRKVSPASPAWATVKREVEILSRVSHPNIVDYISSTGWDSKGDVEIIMGLKDGNLVSLIEGGCPVPVDELATTLFRHILQAIDCLATKKIIHRDLKPENVLYVSQEGRYVFQLGDFGLSNHQISAKTLAGTPLYMAPEMYADGEQTPKVDVWSLYITMLWTLDVGGYREASTDFKTYKAALAFAVSQANRYPALLEMAEPDPKHRATAAQMLVKCFGGDGLSTPLPQVAPLASCTKPKPEEHAAIKAPGAKATRAKIRSIRKMQKRSSQRYRSTPSRGLVGQNNPAS